MIERETEILPTIKHKNIVEYFGIDKMDTEIFIYMELLDNRKYSFLLYPHTFS